METEELEIADVKERVLIGLGEFGRYSVPNLERSGDIHGFL